MPNPIADDTKNWVWPSDVRERFERQRIAIPEPKAPEPRPAEAPTTKVPDPWEEMTDFMWGGL